MAREVPKVGDMLYGAECPGRIVTKSAVPSEAAAAPSATLSEIDQRLTRAQRALDDLRRQIQRGKG
jgi:hypothetical protein